MGWPWILRNFSARTGGPLSIGVPDPLKALPNISSEIGISMVCPVNSQWVYKLSMPEVPSKIYLCHSLPGRLRASPRFKGLVLCELCRRSSRHLRFQQIWETWHCRGWREDRRPSPLCGSRYGGLYCSPSWRPGSLGWIAIPYPFIIRSNKPFTADISAPHQQNSSIQITLFGKSFIGNKCINIGNTIFISFLTGSWRWLDLSQGKFSWLRGICEPVFTVLKI